VPSKETRAAYRSTCTERIATLQAALAEDPCNKTNLAQLEAALDDRDGHVDAGFTAQNEYDARCKDKP
jgi:hypothetical protein